MLEDTGAIEVVSMIHWLEANPCRGERGFTALAVS